MNKLNKVGFMQGRLSPLIGGKIQSFPTNTWRDELKLAREIKFNFMEWTLDFRALYKNPIMSSQGRSEVKRLQVKYDVRIHTLTCDFFMQKPFFKEVGFKKQRLLKILADVIDAAVEMQFKIIVVPLVDNSAINNQKEESEVISEFIKLLKNKKIKVAFESDYEPRRLKNFIAKFPPKQFGINYDIGNSASMGYCPRVEFSEYGDRIINVHVKDRELNGTTVPLGCGNADFTSVFFLLSQHAYSGLYILQTARSSSGDHSGVLQGYREITRYYLR